MVRVREARPDDAASWNEVAHQSPQATYAHTWEWKQTLEQGFGVQSLCLVAEEDANLVGI